MWPQERVPPEPWLPCCALLPHSLLVPHARRTPVDSCLVPAARQDFGLRIAFGSVQMKYIRSRIFFFFPILQFFLLVPHSSPPLDENGHVSTR